MPAGVFNVVTGGSGAIGGEMTSNPIVRKLTFTGSTEVGKLLMEQCAGTVKKVSLELGGNAPFIVFDDADLDAAVDGALASKYRNAGQTCVCANRFLVQDGVYDTFVGKLAGRRRRAQGRAWSRSWRYARPAHRHQGGGKKSRRISPTRPRRARASSSVVSVTRWAGTFFEPTVLAEMTGDMMVTHEETFGPVAPLFRFETEDLAIAMANDTVYGLASYFYSRDVGRIWRVAESLEYGIVGINVGIISNEVAPFGGMKESGIGREGSHFGIDEFLEVKYLCMGGIDA